MLKQTQVEPNGVVVVDLAQLSGIDDLAKFPYSARVYERVVDHQHFMLLLCEMNEFPGLR